MSNERLDAELRARLAELRASRARIVEAGDEQRRLIERDLHDGAQQRLLALGMDLRLAREQMTSDPAGRSELLDAALLELSEATAELRELARGIHPSILANRGLPAALRRWPTIAGAGGDRHAGASLSDAIESAVLLRGRRSLTNAARYASAHEITVTVLDRPGIVEVEVHDDGVGGADPKVVRACEAYTTGSPRSTVGSSWRARR